MKILTLVVTYNEAANIARLIPDILRYLPGSSVLVVDDDSPDGTSGVVLGLQQTGLPVHLITRRGQRGYGSAAVTGLQYGIREGYDVIATLDADYSHDPADLPKLIDATQSADVVIGSRYVGGIRVLNWDVRRLLLSLAANAYIRALSGLKVNDCTAGFRAYRADILRRVRLDQVNADGYAFLPELLFSLDTSRIVEVPTCYTERRVGESKMGRGVIAESVVRPWTLLVRRVGRALRGRRQDPGSNA